MHLLSSEKAELHTALPLAPPTPLIMGILPCQYIPTSLISTPHSVICYVPEFTQLHINEYLGLF